MNIFTELWTVKLSDWQRALICAVLSGPLGIIYDSLQVTPISFTFDWKAILRTAILGFIAYYGKNFMTGSGGKLLTNSK
jgi:hypothetical protein